jgi:hypothetical protein
MENNMPARMLRTVTLAVVAICLCDGAFAVDGGRPRDTSAPIQGFVPWSRPANSIATRKWATSRKQKAVRPLAAGRNPYADPAAPYKASRLSSSDQPIINIPGQTTVLTRQVLDDKNATSLRGALGSTAGVTIGR